MIPQRPRSNFFRQMSQYPMAQAKAKAAEEKAKAGQLAKLTGDEVGRFHYEAYQKEASDLIQNADKYNSLELTERIVKLNTQAQASKSVEKLYDGDVKWAAGKDVPVKTDAWRSAYTQKYYADPSMESVSKWAEEAPNKTWFLQEDGGSQYVDDGKAIKRVIKNNFDGYLTDQQWKRSGWEKAPVGHVADMLTYKKKINAFSTVEKGPDGNDQIVIKDPKDLISEGILTTFMEDEFMGRVLTDKAKELLSSEKGGAAIEDEDVSQFDLARALQQQLVPYVDGAITEAGMTMAIRPPGSGGSGGGKDQKWQQGFELWLKQLSEGSVAALRFPMGGKIGSSQEEVVAFDAILPMATTQAGVKEPKTHTQIFDSPALVRKAFEGKDWFKALTAAQKEEIVNNTMISGKQAGESASALYTYVTRVPAKTGNQPIIAGQPMPVQGYEYQVRVFDPVTDRSTLALLYDSGRGARGNTDYNTIVAGGQQGYEYQGPKVDGFAPAKPLPSANVQQNKLKPWE